MIDYEVKIFNEVYDIVVRQHEVNRFVSTPINDYAMLPAVSLYEMRNTTVQKRQSSTPTENFAEITYQLDVVAKTKEKCRELLRAIDEKMISMNFTRVSNNYVTYPDSTGIVRYVARYEAQVDRNGNIYRAS